VLLGEVFISKGLGSFERRHTSDWLQSVLRSVLILLVHQVDGVVLSQVLVSLS
jgi:hypothetical protein